MRASFAAIALVLAIVAVMPTQVSARAAPKVERWGCTFVAKGIWSGPYLDQGIFWEGVGEIQCDHLVRLTVTTSVLRDVRGEPDRLYAQQKWTMPWGPHRGQWLEPGGPCRSTGTPPSDPFYFRIKAERKDAPGVVWVTSRNAPNPCPAGTWPVPWPKFEGP